MKAGDTPVPPSEDDVYADTGARADIHQLAAKVRKQRQALSELQQQWNDLVKVCGGWGCLGKGGAEGSGVAVRKGEP
jgi:hypothetical protein